MHGYTEDQLVEQPAADLFAKLGWATASALDETFGLDQTNVLNFYSAFFFNPPIPIIGFPPFDSIIWFQGIGIVYHPLSVGTHTLQLDAVNTQPAFGGFFEYHNTWTVTVEPRR